MTMKLSLCSHFNSYFLVLGGVKGAKAHDLHHVNLLLRFALKVFFSQSLSSDRSILDVVLFLLLPLFSLSVPNLLLGRRSRSTRRSGSSRSIRTATSFFSSLSGASTTPTIAVPISRSAPRSPSIPSRSSRGS